jgi:membrane-associated phospholipid phosphatase
MDLIVYLLMCVFLIVGVYQFYFWPQNPPIKKSRSLECKLDNLFSLKPKWVWIYSGLYYPLIILVIATVENMREFNYMAMSYFVLLFMQMFFFLVFPVETPKKWREMVKGDSKSEKMLRLVQSFDKSSNCFPSMHVSVAMLSAMHFMMSSYNLGLWPLLFPITIGLSALYTKQHFIADLLPGAFLGWIAFKIHLLMYVPL